MKRRDWLRAIGVGGAGATLLGPLLSRFARAGETPPCRFVFVVEGNGYEPITVLADEARASLDASMSEPLGDARWWYRRYAHESPMVVEGSSFDTAPAMAAVAADPAVAAQTAVVLGLSSRIAGGGHSAFHGALSSARTIAGVPGGQTIDAYLASLAQVRGATPYDAVRLGVSQSQGEPLDFGTCAFDRGRAAPLILQPTAAYAALFGSVGSAEGRASFMKRRSLLDFASRDVDATLGAFPGNSAERAKLETYLASIEELTARHERVVGLAPQLEAAQPPAPADNPLYGTDDPLDRFRAQLQLATAAFKGELTRVAVVGCGTGGAFSLLYPTVNASVARHDMQHGSASDAGLRANVHEVARLQLEAIAAMASELAATPETGADGSMLDHTLIVYLGDNGEQHHSTASEFPIVLIGGRALGLSTGGRTLVYPGLSSDNHRQLSNLWNTLGHLAGMDLNEFGSEGPSRRAPGPLGELLA